MQDIRITRPGKKVDMFTVSENKYGAGPRQDVAGIGLTHG